MTRRRGEHPDLPGWVNLPPSREQSRAAEAAALVAALRVGRNVWHRRNGAEYEVVEATETGLALRRVLTRRVHHLGRDYALRYLRPSLAAALAGSLSRRT